MSDSNEILFVDRDPHTGQPKPTTYESMRTAIVAQHPLGESLPDDIQKFLLAAIDYFALAYEQANAGRLHLYELLTNDAFVKAVLALELALRRRLGRGTSVRLEDLISAGIVADILPATDEHQQLWEELRKNRNAITHGDPEESSYGPMTARWIRLVIDAINAMCAAVPSDTIQRIDQSPTETLSMLGKSEQ